jgi:hypothetical protein
MATDFETINGVWIQKNILIKKSDYRELCTNFSLFLFVLKTKETKSSRKGHRQPHEQAIPPLPFPANAPHRFSIVPSMNHL